MSPYNPDSEFDKRSLYLLELAQVPVATALAKGTDRFAEVIGVVKDYGGWTGVLESWQLYRPRPRTWRELYEVLRELGLEELSQQIEDYLNCECTLLIACRLLLDII